MKKITSIVLLALMLMTLIPTGIASADTTEPAPYFQLGFTGTAGQAATASDLKGNATSVTAGGNSSSTDAPIFRTDSTTGVNYLEFGSNGEGNARVNGRASIKVLFPDTRLLSGTTETPAAGQYGDYTVEMWANFTSTANWGAVFGFWNDAFNNLENEFRLQTNFKGSSSVRIAADSGNSAEFSPAVAGGGYLNAWKHYTVIRKYDSQTKNFTLSLYIDGELEGAYTSTADPTKSYLASHKGLIIGNNDGERAMTGGIAEFNVYTSALTGEQIGAKYEASAATYQPSDDTTDDDTTDDDTIGDDTTGDDTTGDDTTSDDTTGDDTTGDGTTVPYFELGFSKTGDTVTVSDLRNSGATVVMESTSSKSDTDSAGNAYKDHRPVYSEGPSNNFNYLQFSSLKASPEGKDSDRVNGHSRILVTFPDTSVLSGTTGTPGETDIAEGLTVELWAKVDKVNGGDQHWSGIFAFGDNFGGTAGGTTDIQFRHSSADFKAYNANRAGNGTTLRTYASSGSYVDKWAHYVYTREYDSETKTFTTKLYIDGKEVGSSSLDKKTSSNNYLANWNYMSIGGAGTDKAGFGRSFIGGIATFKVYKTALSGEQIATAFNNSYETYKVFKPECDGTFGTAEDGNPTIDVKIVGSVDHNTVAQLDADGKFKSDIGSVVITSGGKEIRTEMIAYDKTTQTATIKFIDSIGYSEELIIALPNVADADIEGRTLEGEVATIISPAAPADAIFATGEATITNNGTKVDMALEIQNAGDKTFYFDLVVRDASGAFKKMVNGAQTTSAGVASLSVSTNGITLAPDDTITAIAWYLDDVKGATAVSAPISLIYE